MKERNDVSDCASEADYKERLGLTITAKPMSPTSALWGQLLLDACSSIGVGEQQGEVTIMGG
jgi:hypothetical protein